MTMGQRIAQRRKLLGLTQEGLGEQLGVSRQAISKWEADAATPEIDKLIAMSKLFSVSVGWLLGTEDNVATEQKESFSEEQLRMVEQIVKRYRQPEQKHRDMRPAICVGALALAAAAMLAWMGIKSYVNSEVSVLRSQINNLSAHYSSINDQLGNVSDRLEEMAAGERLLSEYQLEAEPLPDWSGAIVHFTAIPRNTQTGDQAWLSVRLDRQEVASAMCKVDGAAYTASVELPAANGYSYYFQVIHTGGDSSLEGLENVDVTCHDLHYALRGAAYGEAHLYEWEDGMLRMDVSVDRSDPYLAPAGEKPQWTQMDLVLLRNGREIDRVSVLELFSDEIAYGEDDTVIEAYPNYVAFMYQQELPDLTEKDELIMQLEYRYGAQGEVTQQMFLVLYLENGELKADHYAMAIQ